MMLAASTSVGFFSKNLATLGKRFMSRSKGTINPLSLFRKFGGMVCDRGLVEDAWFRG